jgi:hypothetical protein
VTPETVVAPVPPGPGDQSGEELVDANCLTVKEVETESHWQDLVTATVAEELGKSGHDPQSPQTRDGRLEQDSQVVREILARHADRTDQIVEWVRRTGKSERAFYRRRAEVVTN